MYHCVPIGLIHIKLGVTTPHEVQQQLIRSLGIIVVAEIHPAHSGLYIHDDVVATYEEAIVYTELPS
jgi:hypothetical protein